MAFPQQFLDEIRARVPLSQLVGRRVQLKQRARDDWWGLSPFASEKSASFHVRDDKGFFHCFSTGEHGDHFSWLMQVEGQSFPEAVESLAGLAGMEVPKSSPEERRREEKRKDLGDVVAFAAGWFADQLEAPAGRAARDYLNGRGLEAQTVEAFQLGFAPDDRDALAAAAKATGIDMPQLIEAGLYRQPEDNRAPYPLFRNRIMFPINDRRGRPIAFGGRFMGDAKAIGVGKYINSPETPLFDKSRTLYNLDRAREPARQGETLLVVEGYMDVIGLWQAGFVAAVAPLGTAVTEPQIAELWRHADEPVFCLDGDEAGRRAALKAAGRAFPQLKPNKSMAFAFMPEGDDPDSLVRRDGAQGLRNILERKLSMSEFMFEAEVDVALLSTPEKQAGVEKRLFELAESIGDQDVRKSYLASWRGRFREVVWSERSKGRNAPVNRAVRELLRDIGKTLGSTNVPRAKALFNGSLMPLAKLLPRRKQQLMIAAFINHPETIEYFSEEALQILFDEDIENLRVKVFTEYFFRSSISGDEMRELLLDSGYLDLMQVVLNNKVYILGKQARPAEGGEGVHLLLEDLFALDAENRVLSEIKALNLRNRRAAKAKLDRGFPVPELEHSVSDILEDDSIIRFVNFQFSLEEAAARYDAVA